MSHRLTRGSRFGLVLAGLTLIALVVRAVQLDQSFLGDELVTRDLATRASLLDVLAGVRSSQEVTPPAFFVLAWAFGKAGTPEVWLRMPSLIAGVALVPVTGLLGARTVGRPAGVVGAALIALSPFAIFYATEARAYSLLALLVALAVLALLRALERGSAASWVLWAALATAAMYTHYTSVFPLAAMVLWAAWAHPGERRALVLSVLGAALAFAPWIPFLIEDQQNFGSKAIQILAPFGWDIVWRDTGRWLAGSPFLPLGAVPGSLGRLLLAVGLLAGTAGAVLAPRVRIPAGREVQRGTALIVLLALSAPLGTAVASIVSTDVFLARNLLASLPAALLGIAALILHGRRPVASVATLLVLCGMAIGAVSTLDRSHQRPDARAAAHAVDALAQPGEAVIDAISFDPRAFGDQLRPYVRRPQRLVRAATPAGAAAARGDQPVVLVSYADTPFPLPDLGSRVVKARRTFDGLQRIVVTAYGSQASR